MVDFAIHNLLFGLGRDNVVFLGGKERRIVLGIVGGDGDGLLFDIHLYIAA